MSKYEFEYNIGSYMNEFCLKNKIENVDNYIRQFVRHYMYYGYQIHSHDSGGGRGPLVRKGFNFPVRFKWIPFFKQDVKY